jgi:tripartite-type tricarboxylate transporter receptor subunit TctC
MPLVSRWRKSTVALLILAASTIVSSQAAAQSYPSRPVTVVVPYAPGGNSDSTTRIVAQRLSEKLGQPFVVENRPGAAGALAAEFVARSAPDGYTLFMSALSQTVLVPVVSKTRYDPVKDFTPVSLIGTNPFVLAVAKDLPVKTVAEFVAYVGARPGQLAYASGGIGTQNHLAMALFLKLAGIEMIHVPYKGNAPSMTDLIAGHVAAMLSNPSDCIPQAAAGQIRLIAITGPQRSSQIPDVPTIGESGYPTYKVVAWQGLMAPAGTPKDVVKLIAGQASEAARDPTFAARLAKLGIDPVGSSPEEFAATIAADIPTWTEAVAIAGVKDQ